MLRVEKQCSFTKPRRAAADRRRFPWAQTWLWLFGWLAAGTAGRPAVWWDNFPRVVQSSTLSEAQAYSASASINGAANDPGWGLWYTYNKDGGAGAASTRSNYAAAGIVSLSYNEAYGQFYAPIIELKWSSSLQRWTYAHMFWNWQSNTNGPVVWAGAWSWFDSFLNDSPTNQSEFSYFARPYTRLHPTYGGGPMTYPDGTIATGFFNNDPSDPRNSRVYDAGSAKDIYGRLVLDFNYNANASTAAQPHNGEIYVPATGQYSGLLLISRDSACPLWTNYTRASTRAAVQLAGVQGTWSDNFGAWDSFTAGSPVNSAFGEWSIALFRNYLTNHFTPAQLYTWGVLATNAPLAAISDFNARTYFLTVASNQFGLNSTNLNAAAWNSTAWQEQPVWRAYKIYRRQNGTEALAAYDRDMHEAASLGGNTNFALLVNDIHASHFGWARGTLDVASTELSLGWNITAGSRGLGLPSFGRVAPIYKTMREHGRSRFVTVWLYNDHYVSALTNRAPVESLYYEMLATHTLPKISIGDTRYIGTPEVQSNFFNFVAQGAAPALADRLPIEEVGIYLSTSTVLAMATPGDATMFNSQDHLYAAWGWGTAMSELHHQYRIVPEWKLTANTLQSLKVLLIPNASVFDPASLPVLQTWVANGGCVVVTGDSGSRLGEANNFDATTNRLVLAPLTGVTNWYATPAQRTNFLGSGAVYYLSNNLGRAYYDATASGRATQRPSLAQVLTNAFNLAGAQPILNSSNAPATVGLTLYQHATAPKTFVDLNNFNVNTNTMVTTPTPSVDIDLARPAWLTSNMTVSATIVSPDGAFSAPAVVVASRVCVRLPPVTNYLSVILQGAILNPPAITHISRATNGNVVLGGAGMEGMGYRVWAAPQLTLPTANWSTLDTGVLSSGAFWFTDSNAPNATRRFYRLSTP